MAQEEEKEEGAYLGRNVRVFQGLEGPEGAGSHSCQGSGTVISEGFSFVLEPCSSGRWNFCPLTSPSHLTFLQGVEGGRNSPSGPAKGGEEDYGYEAPLPPDRCWEL